MERRIKFLYWMVGLLMLNQLIMILTNLLA
jgi:hypothetical protein